MHMQTTVPEPSRLPDGRAAVGAARRGRAGHGPKPKTATPSHLYAEWGVLNPLSLDETSRITKCHWACGTCGHEWWTQLKLRAVRGAGCPLCVRRAQGATRRGVGYEALAAEYSPRNPTPLDRAHSKVAALWVCAEGHEWSSSPNSRLTQDPACPKCKGKRSRAEDELFEFVRRLCPDAEQTSTKALPDHRRTVDIFVPSRMIAFEYNGLFWHSERAGKDRRHHYDRYAEARAGGVQLIQIWEDDWLNNRDAVKALVAHKLGHAPKLRGARAYGVTELAAAQARRFLTGRHLQGYTVSSKYFALSDTGTGEPVALLSATRRKDHVMIDRFATAGSVPGGFRKLLARVRSEWPGVDIVTYSHNDISNGGVYEKAGFTKESDFLAEYYYSRLDGAPRMNRRSFQRSRFYRDPALLSPRPGMTERELAELNGLTRCWSSGNAKWRLVSGNLGLE